VLVCELGGKTHSLFFWQGARERELGVWRTRSKSEV